MINLKELRIDIFRYAIDSALRENLSEYFLSTISNMLAMNYMLDSSTSKSENIHEYASICATKLKNYLQSQILLEDSFSEALSLFVVAISPEVKEEQNHQLLDQLKDKSLVSSIVSSQCLSSLEASAKEHSAVAELVSEVLSNSGSQDLLDLMVSNPGLVLGIIRNRKTKKERLKP